MIITYGRRRLTKIALTIVVLILCVQFMIFITSTFCKQHGIQMSNSAVCECRGMSDFKDKVIESQLHESALKKESTQYTMGNIERKREKIATKSGRNLKFSMRPKVTLLTRTTSLRRPIVSQSAAKIAMIETDALIGKTIPTSSRVAVSKINAALSIAKYISTTERNRAPMTRKLPTIIELSTNLQSLTLDQKIPQSERKLPTLPSSPKPTLQKTPPKDDKITPHPLTNIEEPTVKVLSLTPTERKIPPTVKRAPSAEEKKVPPPTVKKLPPQTFQDVKQPTVKAPSSIVKNIPPRTTPIDRKIPQTVETPLPTTLRKLPQPTIKNVPSLPIKLPTGKVPSPKSTRLPSTASLTVRKTPPTVKKVLPVTMRKLPLSTINKEPLSSMKDRKLPTAKAPPSKSIKVPSAQRTARTRPSIQRKTPPSDSKDRKQTNLQTSQSNLVNIRQKTARLPTPTSRRAPITSKRQTMTQTPNNTNHENRIKAASTSDFSWKTITNTLRIFSSYYDTRYLKTTPYGIYQNSLVIFGYERSKLTNNLFCVVIMDDNKIILVKQPAVRIVLSELWKGRWDRYRAIMYRCNLTIPGNPRYVTFFDNTIYRDFRSLPHASFIPVVNPQSRVIHEFGVCYETPLYGNKYDQGIMDSIEMNKILGATSFTMYVYEAHDKALEILKYYSQELKILDAVLNLGNNMPSPVYNRGLLAGVNDCVYRNMYKVRYLVLCDLDELIMPEQGLNWHDLLLKIDRPNRGYFMFRHLGFHKNQTKATEVLPCPGQINLTYKMPRFFATHNRSVSVLSRNRQVKSIAKPRYSIAVHVHFWRWMMPGYSPYFVPTDLALMKHYRDKDDPRYMNYSSTIDYSMDRFKPAILAAIEEHYCRNIKHVAR